ncbi:MAG TPA: hypothetical protein PLY86_06630 [bacterium]|nr:hypothetical protein [bacterium]
MVITRNPRILLFLLCAFVATAMLSCTQASLQSTPKTTSAPITAPEDALSIDIRHYGLGPGSWHLYSSMNTAPNGDIYIGICNYSYAMKMNEQLNGAHLVRYRPSEDRMEDLGDMQDVTGQRGQDNAFAQSKIHTPILFGPGDYVYFGTHSVERDYVPEEFKPRFTEGYPGGHWVRYDPRTNTFHDLGIPANGESLMGITLESKHQKIFATTHKKALLVEYDIRTGKSTIRGSIGEYPTRMIGSLSDGNVYTVNDRGWILRYNPDNEKIEKLPLRIPSGSHEAELISIFALCTNPARDRLYGISTLIDEPSVKNVIRGGYLFEFIPQTDSGPTLKDLGNAGITDDPVLSEAGLYHAMAYGKDDKIYWASPTRGRPVHLASYDTRTGERADYGELWFLKENAYVHAIFAGCTGNDGMLYWGGLLKAENEKKWDNEVVLISCDPKSLKNIAKK